MLFLTSNLSGNGPLLNPRLHTPALNAEFNARWPVLSQQAITIYPDSITDNPLGARHVVRYVLGKEVIPDAGKAPDFRLYYSKAFPTVKRGDQRVLYLLPFELALFNDLHTSPTLERSQDLLWIGKGGRYVGPERPDCKQITYSWPETREALADELRRTRFLYSYDTLSATNLEAILCGAVVVLKTMHYHGWTWSRRDVEAMEPGSGGFAFADTSFEIDRALATRSELVENVRHTQAMFRQQLWEFVRASQSHFAGEAVGSISAKSALAHAA